ncbi:MAG: NADH-quinone oxidoreductase subunit NuoF, partial [Bacteriovoracaceae bacterium]|nr:NADH-quinone oxidoreductase subunit NuoF [Bacteriovoracaceae bacterium]
SNELANYKDYALLSYHHIPNVNHLEVFEKAGGYAMMKACFDKDPEVIKEEVKNSGLRGRGGAGFPTGVKWGFFTKDRNAKKYLVCNADESEPGTFKDRYLVEKCPHILIEGMIISAWALGIQKGYIYIRGEFYRQAEVLEAAIKEAYAKGYLGKNILGKGFDFDLYVHRGAGAYICGEETGLISSLEGKKGQPKLKPPFPAIKGYRGLPTMVNNVESLAAVPWIMRFGAQAYKQWGSEKSPGTKLFSISGDVNKPGVIEVPLGTTLKEIIEVHCGGMRNGGKLKAVIPGGSSAPIFDAEASYAVKMDYEDVAAKGSMLGSGAIVVIDDTRNMGDVLKWTLEFYHHESCGQCTPCREGTGWLESIFKRRENGTAKKEDVDLLDKVAASMRGQTICALADAAAMPTQGMIKVFRSELESYVTAQVKTKN